MKNPAKGNLLISEPFLQDAIFHRSVILLADHAAEGTHGYVLNHPTALTVQDIFEDFECSEKVYIGGPVGQDTFHFIHTLDTLEGAVEIKPGIFLGGDFELLKFLFRENMTGDARFRFFAGYSGWGAGQLEFELAENSWILTESKSEFIFSEDGFLWKHILSGMGGEYQWLSNAPDDLRSN